MMDSRCSKVTEREMFSPVQTSNVLSMLLAGVQIKVAWHKEFVRDKEGKGVGRGYTLWVKKRHIVPQKSLTAKKSEHTNLTQLSNNTCVQFAHLWSRPADRSWCGAPCKPGQVGILRGMFKEGAFKILQGEVWRKWNWQVKKSQSGRTRAQILL